MGESTRRRTRNVPAVTPGSPSDETVSPVIAPVDSRYATPIPTHFRDNASRLSEEEIEPMDLHGNDQEEYTSHTDEHSSALGSHIQECIATIDKLEKLGLSKHNIPLPKCIVLGEQSTGKSSVIEGLSGITTPRADDVCTRCPIYINLAPSKDPSQTWTARVTLRRNFAFDGMSKEGRQFRGWYPIRETEEEPFAIATREQLTHVISRAQSAIINPREDPSTFLQPTLPINDRDAQTDFSPNIVCIYISAPGLPNLSFYDLPGIINQADTVEKEYLIEFVRALVTKYIQAEDSLILVTCALDTDIANSSAAALARALKADGRCIGVLTKPDRIDPNGSHEKIRGVLEGTRFALGHGYFVVKNLSQVQIDTGLTHRDAREGELHFFSGKPWSTSFQNHQSRFGTIQLQNFLSKKLAANVVNKLPAIHDMIDSRLQAVEDQLDSLPKPPQSAVRTVTDILQAFSENVKRQMEGGHGYTDWTNIWDDLRHEFLNNLEAMKPVMLRAGAQDKGLTADWLPGGSSTNPMSLDSADESDTIEAPRTPAKKHKLNGSPMSTPSKTPNTAHRAGAGRNSQLPTPAPTATQSNFKDLRTKFQLDDLAARVEQESKSNFNILRPEVLDDITMSTLRHWHLPKKQFFTDFEHAIKQEIRQMFHNHFLKWESAPLYQTAWVLVENMLNIHIEQQRDTMAQESLMDELDQPYYFPKDFFEPERVAKLKYYTKARQDARFQAFEKQATEQLGHELTSKELEKAKKNPKVLEAICNDPYAKEVDLIAKVVAYYITAMHRFHAAVCIRIQSKLFRALKHDLRNEMDSGLGIHDDDKGPENARSLLEDPRREKRRQDLLADQRNLLAGQQILKDLQNKYGDTPPKNRYGMAFTPSDHELEDVFA